MEIDAIEFERLKSLLALKGELKLRVASDSMHPVLRISQIITVRPCHSNSLKKFDIIVFWEQGKMVCHLLWARQKNKMNNESLYITKSLKSPLDHDIPIVEKLILGKVENKLSLMRRIFLLLGNLYKNL
jgi:hypothetical protein